jgi:hypothetical protein
MGLWYTQTFCCDYVIGCLYLSCRVALLRLRDSPSSARAFDGQ